MPGLWLSLALAAGLQTVSADTGGRLLATGGATQIEGAAGGGIVPWAVIAGYGTEDQWGADFTLSQVRSRDLSLNVAAVSVGIYNRLELSVASQSLDVDPLGLQLRQEVFGTKVRLVGDLVYTAMPQVSAGMQYKRHRDMDVPASLGARDDSDVEYYLSASKLFLAGPAGRSLLVNGTLRATRANQIGLLGFGGDERDSHQVVTEISAALFLDRNTAVGFEYRQKPDNLSSVKEDDWADVFIAWFPSKHLSLVGAYTRLGSVAGLDRQSGPYLSLQASF